MNPERPILRYHGGKWRLAPWIISHFPEHKVYVEPFGGGASVLFNKTRSTTEIYNELDGELVNLFHVLKDGQYSEKLRHLLELTTYARDEYNEAYEPTDCFIERARRTLVKTWFGMHSKGLMNKNGFDTRLNSDGFIGRVRTFTKLPELIPAYMERLKGVVIEHTDGIDLIPRADAEHTLFYVDPPYLLGSRSAKYYRHEMTDDDHRKLASVLNACQGMVVLSGYPSDLYDQELYPGWHRDGCNTLTDGAHRRMEVLWLNDAAWHKQKNLSLFS